MALMGTAGIGERANPITIGFRCKSGRHRSCAVMCAVSAILEEWEVTSGLKIGFATPHTEVCGCPDACSNLQRPIKRLKPLVDASSREAVSYEWLQDGTAAISYAKRLWKHLS